MRSSMNGSRPDLDLFLKIGKPSLVIAMILGKTSGDASAPVSYAEGDELLVARLKVSKGFSKET